MSTLESLPLTLFLNRYPIPFPLSSSRYPAAGLLVQRLHRMLENRCKGYISAFYTWKWALWSKIQDSIQVTPIVQNRQDGIPFSFPETMTMTKRVSNGYTCADSEAEELWGFSSFM